MLRNSLDQAAHDALPDAIKVEYTKIGSTYILQHDEPAGELKRAKDRETESVTRLSGELATAKAATTALQTKIDAMPTVETLKAEATTAVEKEFEPVKTQLATRDKQLTDLLVEGEARKIALAVGGTKNADALLPHITPRLAAKLDGDTPGVAILKDGKESKLTSDELTTEIRGDKKLSSLVIANPSSGGAGRQVPSNMKSPASGAGNTTPNLATMSPADLVASLPAPAAQ